MSFPKSSLLVCCTLASLLALPACSHKIPKDKLEASVKSAFEKANLKFKSLSCPADKELKAGDKFECTGELEEGQKATVTVTQKDDKGSLAYDVVGSVEQESAIAEFVTKKSGVKTELTCPKKIAILRKGDTFTCGMTQGAEKGKLVATGLEDDKVNYKVELDGKPEGAAIAAEADAPVEGTAAAE